MKRTEIQKAIRDKEWQKFRLTLKGLSTETKLKKLEQWVIMKNKTKKSQIQKQNYINALKRGGLIK